MGKNTVKGSSQLKESWFNVAKGNGNCNGYEQ